MNKKSPRWRLNIAFSFLILVSMILFGTHSTSIAAEITLLTGQPGTSQTGTWGVASGATRRLNNHAGLYAISGSGATYTFRPTLPANGNYLVEIFNNCYAPRSHSVTHTISHATGVETFQVTQDCADGPNKDPYVGQWRPLGTFPFHAGTTGALTLTTIGANNSYVGVSAVRFSSTSEPGNSTPVLSVSTQSLSVSAGDLVELSAVANDAEDGNLSASIVWAGQGVTGNGTNFSLVAGSSNFIISATVADSGGLQTSTTVDVTVTSLPPPPTSERQFFGFDCAGNTPLQPLIGFTTNNASALPNIGTRCGRYMADLLSNANDITLHFNMHQGRFDGVPVSFPFTVIARDVRIAPLHQPDTGLVVPGAYLFTGVQIHHADFANRNSAHVVVGQRGSNGNTIEGKHTRNGTSEQDDIGANTVPNGRADLRIEGNTDRTLTVYWQLHQAGAQDNWIAYDAPHSGRTPGILRGPTPDWGETVYVGLITYAFGQHGVPFTGVVDSLEVTQH